MTFPKAEFTFTRWGGGHYRAGMALVRILVDGYSLLHSWPELARGQPRHSAAARDELIRWLTLYHDALGTPITVFFDGQGKGHRFANARAKAGVEVLFSRTGQTADQMIERTVHNLQPYGEVLVITDDSVERETVGHFGGMVSSCLNFIQTVENTLTEMAEDIKQHNRREHYAFKKGVSRSPRV
ncbi:MAG TPA: NYN domain-containing protein [Verrucomicrobiae bacterium]|nr:NYN domain-containing protein [Verrucomicrobiae bacterium]